MQALFCLSPLWRKTKQKTSMKAVVDGRFLRMGIFCQQDDKISHDTMPSNRCVRNTKIKRDQAVEIDINKTKKRRTNEYYRLNNTWQALFVCYIFPNFTLCRSLRSDFRLLRNCDKTFLFASSPTNPVFNPLRAVKIKVNIQTEKRLPSFLFRCFQLS